MSHNLSPGHYQNKTATGFMLLEFLFCGLVLTIVYLGASSLYGWVQRGCPEAEYWSEMDQCWKPVPGTRFLWR